MFTMLEPTRGNSIFDLMVLTSGIPLKKISNPRVALV